MSGAALFTPGAVLVLGVDAAIAYGQVTHSSFSRRTWVAQMLVEELLSELPTGNALRALRRLFVDGYGVSESAADAAFSDLVHTGWLVAEGIAAEAAWTLDVDRAEQVDQLWRTLSEAEARAVRAAAQRTMAISVAWSKKRRAGVDSSTSTSKSAAP